MMVAPITKTARDNWFVCKAAVSIHVRLAKLVAPTATVRPGTKLNFAVVRLDLQACLPPFKVA